jgi:hypothetical protein
MTIEQILGLQPGPELDRLVHEHVFGKVGRRKAWSTTSAALELIGPAAIAAGPRPSTDPDFKADRPFWASTFEHISTEESGHGYVTTNRVFSATLPLAICKAALISTLHRKPADQ